MKCKKCGSDDITECEGAIDEFYDECMDCGEIQ